jgi:uncharacterized membrane protein YfcA
LCRRDLRAWWWLDPGTHTDRLGPQPSEVAAGVVTFTILSAHEPGSVAPDWPTGLALCIGGLAGGYTGARIQSRLPDAMIRRLVGGLVMAIGIFCLWSGLVGVS